MQKSVASSIFYRNVRFLQLHSVHVCLLPSLHSNPCIREIWQGGRGLKDVVFPWVSQAAGTPCDASPPKPWPEDSRPWKPCGRAT